MTQAEPKPIHTTAPSSATIQAIRERWARATPGPWGWFGHVSRTSKHTAIRLSSKANGNIVMDFKRVGKTNDAQPRFGRNDLLVGAREFVKYEVGYREQIDAIDHPDAKAIAAAPEDVRTLLEALEVCRNAFQALKHAEDLKQSIVPAEAYVSAPIAEFYARKAMQEALFVLGLTGGQS
ncbi:hypothetical protein [Deinococcus cellulosilyticus]|uniref:Uncharacterized protein n=1 Tax=Deinococcus cellulosilyticus (strain DSM 18568 / NBRC 106333 / KACC 11606 / 5516J-15) TaxID=1223518 RepID=A0A511MW48_DEIC1|nr:hypothetical protein [Deinococcus cellulosilyticus]GEM44802.1 hypothetical protein DC3_04370 [Deinococcus cellulosilyticus NBRC 106333 = KACC 11606]